MNERMSATHALLTAPLTHVHTFIFLSVVCVIVITAKIVFQALHCIVVYCVNMQNAVYMFVFMPKSHKLVKKKQNTLIYLILSHVSNQFFLCDDVVLFFPV